MTPFSKPAPLEWTLHAQAKMRHYRLSQSRVRHVLHTPKRVEEGVAPKTIAAMQPASMKTKDTWTQEIWVMVQDTPKARKIISAWRYPGVSKARSAAILTAFHREYDDFIEDAQKRKI
jgi:hypothetical protein